ncbi:hypothetical protein AMTR_s00046p00216210 [Amborella trichopoda]|uniref:Uncharacterized protein n=1 Tax=Amborella trichopoda TaxID=13333 RepID=U5D9H6_AMBTC|nr:hypothetical protein AMTR_s00046p00216210 [Amborella trichopoda]
MGILSRLNIGLVPCWCLIVIREKKLSEKDADTSSSSALSWFETDSLWFASLSTRSWRILLPLNIDLVLCWCLIVLREKRRARRTRRLLLPRLYHGLRQILSGSLLCRLGHGGFCFILILFLAVVFSWVWEV